MPHRSGASQVVQGFFLAGQPRVPPRADRAAGVAQASSGVSGCAPPPVAPHVAAVLAAHRGPAPSGSLQRRTAAPLPVPTTPSPRAFPVPPGLLRLPPSSAGRALPVVLQRKMSAALGADLSDVRVFEGPQAAAIGAVAFTMGSQIHFAPGRYDPATPHGQRLIAHELMHVVQQRQGRVRNPLAGGLAVVQDPALEAEADRCARRATSQGAAPSPFGSYRCQRPARGVVQRVDEDALRPRGLKRKEGPETEPEDLSETGTQVVLFGHGQYQGGMTKEPASCTLVFYGPPESFMSRAVARWIITRRRQAMDLRLITERAWQTVDVGFPGPCPSRDTALWDAAKPLSDYPKVYAPGTHFPDMVLLPQSEEEYASSEARQVPKATPLADLQKEYGKEGVLHWAACSDRGGTIGLEDTTVLLEPSQSVQIYPYTPQELKNEREYQQTKKQEQAIETPKAFTSTASSDFSAVPPVFIQQVATWKLAGNTMDEVLTQIRTQAAGFGVPSGLLIRYAKTVLP